MGQLLYLGMCGCGNLGGLESQCVINCTKSSKKWIKSTSSTPSQPNCPHSMNGSTPAMMRAHMWMVLVVEPDLLDSEMLFNRVCTLGVVYTHSPTLKLGCLLANSFADPWYWANRSIFPWYFSPIKEKHCNTVVYGIVL